MVVSSLTLVASVLTLLGWLPATWARWERTGPLAFNGTDWNAIDYGLELSLGAPPRAVYDAAAASRSVFVAISSFRDGARCGKTLELLFGKAQRPHDVSVGLVDQRADDDVKCVDEFCRNAPALCALHRAQVRETAVRAADSKGPVFARAKQTALLRDELFCLQIDAHSQFVERWDDELVAEWLKTDNEYAVLSTYVHHIDRLPINHLHDDVPYICKTKWGEGGMVRNEQASSCIRLTRPKLTFTWGAGLSFSKCHAVRRVPYDPNLPQVFDGEEFSIAMRLFTNGYDVYTPGRNLVFHDYSPVPRHWSAESASLVAHFAEKQKSWARLRTLMRMKDASGEDLGFYGLGQCRSFESFVDFSGVDPRINKASLGERCGNMVRVPWSTPDCWPVETLPPTPTRKNVVAAQLGIVQTKDKDDVIPLAEDEDDGRDASDGRSADDEAARLLRHKEATARRLRRRLNAINYFLFAALAGASLLLWLCHRGATRRSKDEFLSV